MVQPRTERPLPVHWPVSCGSRIRCWYREDIAAVRSQRDFATLIAAARNFKSVDLRATQQILPEVGFVSGQGPVVLDRKNDCSFRPVPGNKLGAFIIGLLNDLAQTCLRLLYLPNCHDAPRFIPTIIVVVLVEFDKNDRSSSGTGVLCLDFAAKKLQVPRVSLLFLHDLSKR